MAVLLAGAGTTTPSTLQVELIEKIEPDVWMGMPSYALHLASLAEQNGHRLADGSVDLVITSAEPISEAKREKIELMWGARLRDSFGMTEAGMMGGGGWRSAAFGLDRPVPRRSGRPRHA